MVRVPRHRARCASNLIAVSILMTGLAACGNDAGAGEADGAIRVAIVGDLTGPFAPIQGSAVPGALTVIDQVNEAGGIGGDMKIEVAGTYDAASGADTASAAARRAIGDEPDLIFSMTGSVSAVATAPLFYQQDVPVLAAYQDDSMSYPPKNIWGFNTGVAQWGQVALDAVKAALGEADLSSKRIGYEVLDSPGAQAISKVVQSELEQAGATTTGVDVMASGATSFGSQAAKVARENPDIYLTTDGAANTAVLVAALRTAGYQGPILVAGDGLQDEGAITAIGDENFYAARPYNPPLAGTELAAAAEKYGHDTKGDRWTAGWVMAQVMVAALEACGDDCDPAALTTALDGLGEFNAPGDATPGPLLFGEDHHAPVYSIQLYQFDKAAGATKPFGDVIQVEGKESY